MTLQSTSPLQSLREPRKKILKHVQGRAFPEELNYPIKTVKKSSRLYKLDPHVKDGLLCVGGRLRNASLPSETKNQIILQGSYKKFQPFFKDFSRVFQGPH